MQSTVNRGGGGSRKFRKRGPSLPPSPPPLQMKTSLCRTCSNKVTLTFQKHFKNARKKGGHGPLARMHSVKTPRRSYAKGFENVRRVGHNTTPLVAYQANNCPHAQIFHRHATAKERRVKEILETSLLKPCPCSLSGAKAFTFHLYVFSGRALFYVAIARNKGNKMRLILIQDFAYR